MSMFVVTLTTLQKSLQCKLILVEMKHSNVKAFKIFDSYQLIVNLVILQYIITTTLYLPYKMFKIVRNSNHKYNAENYIKLWKDRL